jgi:GrpB-like predicted nucleotidyltransferase (UPF0157 family)
VNEPVIIVEYDSNWVAVFSQLRGMLAIALGSLPAAIEHVGSTSVPGAAAKPIIDIDIVLGSGDDLPTVISLLAKLGYRHVGDLGIAGREAFDNPPGLPAHHLYVVVAGNSEHMRHLRFRDYLRSHPEVRDQYSALKKSLGRKFGDDREAYTEAKTAFIEDVLNRAGNGSRRC